MRFKKHWSIQQRLGGGHGGVKAFEQAHLQDAAGGMAACCNKGVRLGQGDGQRFLDQHVQPVIERQRSHFIVRGGRNADGEPRRRCNWPVLQAIQARLSGEVNTVMTLLAD